MAPIRVRFAPSPTGFFHIGSARTALFNWLFARHYEGTFVLRIEDTDKARNTEEALRVLLDGMRWLGLNWDEGPEVGGDYGPYFQSQRGYLYREQLERLAAAGRAYEKEGAWWFRIEGERETVYDDYRKMEVEKVKVAPTIIEDAVRGRVERPVDEDFVIFRASGDPVFHFVNVVDDIAMGISHVIRGEDHLSNTARHVELFKALGAPVPVFAHIPLILKSSGPGKMSKRDQGALIEDYERRGFLAEALRNYLCLLGWNPKDDREKMSIEEIIAAFSLEGINKDNARFDEKKLAHLNITWLRELPVETLTWMARGRLTEAGVISEETDEDYLQNVLRLAQPKMRDLENLPDLISYCFTEAFEYAGKPLRKVLKGDSPRHLASLRPILAELPTPWAEAALDEVFQTYAKENEVEVYASFPALRMAISGQPGGPDLIPLLATLGASRILPRIERFLAAHPAE